MISLFKKSALIIISKKKSLLINKSKVRELATKNLFKELSSLNKIRSAKLIFAEDLVYSLSVSKNSKGNQSLRQQLEFLLPEDLDKIPWQYSQLRGNGYNVFSLGSQANLLLGKLKSSKLRIESVHSLVWLFKSLINSESKELILIVSLNDFLVLASFQENMLLSTQFCSEAVVAQELKLMLKSNPNAKVMLFKESTSKLSLSLAKNIGYQEKVFSLNDFARLCNEDKLNIKQDQSSSENIAWYWLLSFSVILLMVVIATVMWFFK